MKKKLSEHEVSCGKVFAETGLIAVDDHPLKARPVSRIEDLIEERKLIKIREFLNRWI